MSSFFPYEKVRPQQDKLIDDITSSIFSKSCLIAHAPTGLGKTAAALAPAIEYALKSNKTVFFLTSRHTQHTLAIDTLRQINAKGVKFSTVDIVGKKFMCARDEVATLSSRQFHDYCKSLRENDSCSFFLNVKRGANPTDSAKRVIDKMGSEPMHVEQTVKMGKACKVCPYEVAALASVNAQVIIADYYYIFHPSVRESFLKKTSKQLENSVVIVDEAHNLPDRMREMLTDRISLSIVSRAISEAEKWADPNIGTFLLELRNIMSSLQEGLIPKQALIKPFSEIEETIDMMSNLAQAIRETSQQSYIGSIADFMSAWINADEIRFSRILSSVSQNMLLTMQCLDPSIESAEVIKMADSVILMSGTLSPTSMYRDLLGFPENTLERVYDNPMPQANRKSIIVTSATTQFSKRSLQQFMSIGEICSRASDAIPGNVAVYFPSYDMLGKIHPYLSTIKPIFKEHKGMSKEDKHDLLNGYIKPSPIGNMLLAVIGGSFSEGVNLPGSQLNGVMIVGLPLSQPDLKTKELIRYYQSKFGKGWDYGYVLPAFTKTLQTAGRCIRSETDRGVILFIDERYSWDRYYGCFPKDFRPKMTRFYLDEIRDFFKSK